jgi:hypothetical protein
VPESTFYLEPGSRLSQGDLIRDIPWGLIPGPVAICRPRDKSKSEGGAFYAPHERIRQGGTAFAGGRDEVIHASGYLGMGLVLWEDCEIDKFEKKQQPPEKWFVAIAPVLPSSNFPPEIWEGIKAGERTQFFHLAALDSKGLSESYADLRYIWSVKQSILKNRVVTLSDTVRRALYDHLFWFLTSRRLRDTVLCTHCFEPLAARELFEG